MAKRARRLLVVAMAAIIAFLPLIGRTFSFLQQSRASFEGPFGIKVNFSAAAAVASVGTVKLVGNLVQPGVVITDSGSMELNDAALKLTEQSVAVINLEDGQAWYTTRLFAVAATAEILQAPKWIVLLGQRGGQPDCVAGWIRPSDVVKALMRSHRGYAQVWQHAQSYLYRLKSHVVEHHPQFPKLTQYQYAFTEVGTAAIMSIIVDQMRWPDPPMETQETGDPWMTLGDAETTFDAWLVRETVDLGKPEREQVTAIMAAKSDFMIATRDVRYAGVIDVRRAERELLRQLVVQSTSS